MHEDMTLSRVDFRVATFIASNDHAFGTPCCDEYCLERRENVCEGEKRGSEEVTPEDRQEKRFENVNGGHRRCGEEIGEAKRDARRIQLSEMGL